MIQLGLYGLPLGNVPYVLCQTTDVAPSWFLDLDGQSRLHWVLAVLSLSAGRSGGPVTNAAGANLTRMIVDKSLWSAMTTSCKQKHQHGH